MNQKIFMTVAEVAVYCRVSISALAQWRRRNYGPRCFGTGKYLRYRREDVERFAEQRNGKTQSQLVKDGIERARRNGSRLGRPRNQWIDDRILMSLHLSGFSLRAIANELDISHRMVHARLKQAPLYQRYQKEIKCLKEAKQGLTEIRRWLQMKIQEA